MTSDAGTGARGRSLQDDLLEDLRQGVSRPPTAAAPAPEPSRPAAAAPEPAVELRITPRAWSPAGIRALPSGRGYELSVGPLRLSLARSRP
jgi:hypothetical protein